MNIYNIPLHLSLSEIVKTLICNPSKNNNSSYLIITPNIQIKENFLNLVNSFNNKLNNCNNFQIFSISEPEYILQNLCKLNSLNIEQQINTKLINTYAKNFILSNLITKYLFENKNTTKINLQQAIVICEELTSFLDILNIENISLHTLTHISPNSSNFSEKIFTLLHHINNIWKKFSKEHNVDYVLTYQAKLYNLISQCIESLHTNLKIIIFPVNNYATPIVQFLKNTANYDNGIVCLSGIDYNIPEHSWNELNYTHPQYINKQILKKLKITKQEVKCISEILNNNIDFSQPNNANILPRIFDKLPYKLSNIKPLQPPNNITFDKITYVTAANEEDEAQQITQLIVKILHKNPNENIIVATNNIDTNTRIAFHLKNKNIPHNNAIGTKLNKTQNYNFFMLISSIKINKINFIDLLSLLKNPLSKFSQNLYYIELIDKHLARNFNHYTHLKEYLAILDNKLQNQEISNDEYDNIKKIITDITNIFETYPNQNLQREEYVFSFKATLEQHIKIATILSYQTSAEEYSIWQNCSGITLKAELDNLLKYAEYLPKVTISEYNYILIELLKQFTVTSLRNTNTQINICDINQAQYLDEKSTIIIADMNENSFPSATKSSITFIDSLLKKHHLPSAYDNIGKEALIFNKLCYFSKVYLFRSVKKQNVITTPSRFIIKLRNTLKNNSLQFNELTTQITPKYVSKLLNSYINIEVSPPIHLRPKSIYVTAIEKLLQNPYTFFIEHILKLKSLSNINPKFTATNAGSIIHQIFNNFFIENAKNLSSLDKATIQQKLIAISEKEFNLYSTKYMNVSVYYYIFKYFSKNISQFIHQLSQNYNIFDSEKSVTMQIPNKNGTNITIKGRADCIASHGNQATIIDFKTGNIKINKEEINKYKKQLIILGYIFMQNNIYTIDHLEYWVIPNTLSNNLQKTNLSNLLNLDTSIEEYINTDMDTLNNTLMQYLTTEIPFTYRANYKEYNKEYLHFARMIEINSFNK